MMAHETEIGLSAMAEKQYAASTLGGGQKQVSPLDEIQRRLRDVSSRLAASTCQLHEHADAVFGCEPPTSQATGLTQVQEREPVDSVLGRFIALVAELERQALAFEHGVSRNCKLA